MTKEEISKFAFMITYVGTQTEVVLRNGNKLTGYFDNNASNTDLHKQNKWNFVSFTPSNNGSLHLLEGDEFVSITISPVNDHNSDNLMTY